MSHCPSLRCAAGAFLFLAISGTAMAQKDDVTKPRVYLELSEVSITRYPDGDLLFRYRVVLDNRTGKALTVQSRFASAFDGMGMVVYDQKGKQLANQGYTYHQSPFSPEPRGFPLNPGKTEAILKFPLQAPALQKESYQVQIIGTLPGSAFKGALSTKKVSAKPQSK